MNIEDIRFNFLDTSIVLKDRKKLRRFISEEIQKKGRIPGKIYFFFCSDKQLLGINKEFLKHDYYTDIITFNWNEKKEISGEVYISVDRLRENAENYGTTIKNELHRLVFHGILHLLGYSDKKRSEKLKMTREEDLFLKNYFES